MTTRPEEIIAALVAKLDGDVAITWRELEAAQHLELNRFDEPAYMRVRFTAGPPPEPPTIAEILEAHPEWTWSEEREAVGCEGCDWSKAVGWKDKASDMFREHQADMIAAAGFTLP